jgi:cbb3-type cytochrome c oxidase subunit III
LRRIALLPLAALALVPAGCGTAGLAETSGDTSNGKLLFKQSCGGCHTLKEAGTRSDVGPDLDAAFSGPRQEGFDESTIRATVREQIDYAVPPMPRKLVQGAQADDVAAYVAAVAANPKAKIALPAGAGGNDPKLLFESNCGSCHTLADAGTTGTIGPNLDQAKPSVAKATTQIENGGGGMPPFKGQLTPQQIKALAEYVHRVTAGR